MGTENQNVKTGNEAFDYVISSVQLLHEYIQVNDDNATFALVFGGTLSDENTMHCINVMVGNLSSPPVFEAALQSIVKTMKESDIMTRLIFSAYHSYQTNGKVKVVKMKVDSPLDALVLLKNIIDNVNSISDLEQIPSDLLEMIINNLEPDVAKRFYNEELCDDPNCPACSIKRKLRKKGEYVDFSDFPFFGKDTKGEKGN